MFIRIVKPLTGRPLQRALSKQWANVVHIRACHYGSVNDSISGSCRFQSTRYLFAAEPLTYSAVVLLHANFMV
jgi:hypothetical protein